MASSQSRYGLEMDVPGTLARLCASGKTVPFPSRRSASVEPGLVPGLWRSLITGESMVGDGPPVLFGNWCRADIVTVSFQGWVSFSLRNNHLRQNAPLCSVLGSDLAVRGRLLKDTEYVSELRVGGRVWGSERAPLLPSPRDSRVNTLIIVGWEVTRSTSQRSQRV